MNADEQKAAVFEHLKRREQIAAQTKELLEERPTEVIDPLAHVDPAVREAAEDEYYAAKGRNRYRTSDGRTLFLTPEEIAHRRRARGQRHRPRRAGNTFYGASSTDRHRKLVGMGFNVGVVLLALVVVWLILH